MQDIIAKSITIVNDDGKTVLAMKAHEGGAGMWIMAPDGKMIAIYAINGQTAIGIYDKKGAEGNSQGMPLALSIDADGQAFVQFRNDKGNIELVAIEDLKK